VETFSPEPLRADVRGIFVVELIGGGKSTRCLIRKGALRFVAYSNVAGQAIRVLDEKNFPLPPGRVSAWIDGREYKAADTPRAGGVLSDEIIIPFSGSAGERTMILTLDEEGRTGAASGAASGAGGEAGASNWSFSSLHSFYMHSEGYAMDVTWHMDTQQLVRDNRKAKVVFRPRLFAESGGTR